MKIRVTTILAASGLIALGACTDPSLNGGTSGAGTGPGGLSRTQQGALAGAAIGAVHTRSGDAGEWLKNIGKPKGKRGAPQDSRGHRGALPQWGTMHDARSPPRSEGRRHACGTRTPERAVVPAPDCTKPGKKRCILPQPR